MQHIKRYGWATALVMVGLLAGCGTQEDSQASAEVGHTHSDAELLLESHHPEGKAVQVRLPNRDQPATVIIRGDHAYLGDDIIGDVRGDVVIGLSGQPILRLDGGLHTLSSGITDAGLKWPGATVPYVYDASATANIRTQFEQAVQIYNTQTVVRFVPRTNQANYVRVKADASGCYSYVGMMSTGFKPNGQELALGSNGCGVGGALHEMGHAAGFMHEQSRQDRDQYITVNYNAIDQNWWSQYDIIKDNRTNTAFTPYDIHSIMHYGNSQKNGVWAMTSKQGVAPDQIGKNSGYLTDSDKQGLRSIYGAGGGDGGGTTTPPPTAQVCFYEHINYGGASFCTSSGSASMAAGWNDRISSVKVPTGYQVQLFADNNYGGTSKTLTGNVTFVGADFNDRASSFKIFKTN